MIGYQIAPICQFHLIFRQEGMRWIHNTALQNSKTFAHRHATFWSLPFALAKTLALPLTETLGLAETVSQAGWWAAPEAWKRDDETLHCFFPDFADQQLDTPAEWKMCLPFLCYRYLVWGLVPFESVYRRQQGWWDCDTVGRVFFLPKLTGIIFQVWIRQLFFFLGNLVIDPEDVHEFHL